MYIRSTFSQQAFFIDLQLPLLTTKTTRALIDSGASDNFIDPSIINVPPHLIQNLPQPITLQLFDGSTATSGQISQFISIPVTFPRGEVQHLDFFFTTLHPHSPIVLGFSWLQEYNPNIDWKTLTLHLPRPPSPSTPLGDRAILDTISTPRPANPVNIQIIGASPTSKLNTSI